MMDTLILAFASGMWPARLVALSLCGRTACEGG
jgi:hypothetical protein